jgi:hypothetical protein
MIKFFFTYILLCAVCISAHCENVASLIISHPDGTTTSFHLSTKPCITFLGDSVKIATPTVNAEFLAKDVLRFTYMIPATAIKNTAANSQLKNDGEYLILEGNVKMDTVKMFTSDGRKIPTKFAMSANGLRLRISSLQKGIYLIYINGSTSKFLKR